MIDYAEAFEKLSLIHQEHILAGFEAIVDKEKFLKQIESIDPRLFVELKELPPPEKRTFSPLTNVSKQGDAESVFVGEKAIADGLVGALVVAGGQGTRLGFNHPKGMFPVTRVKHKTLFQLFVEKMIACGKKAGRGLKMAFMTSQENDQETRAFFENNGYFVDFFTQGELPLINEEGNLFLRNPGEIAMGSDGNGSAIADFVKSGLFSKWKREGIRYIVFSLVDNPLADPYDAELVGRMILGGRDVVIKAVERLNLDEKVGVLVQEDGKVSVVEYSEFPKDQDSMLFNAANISLFCFSMDFMEEVANKKIPLHAAHKAVPYVDEEGEMVQPKSPNAWKFERFIFDVLQYASNVETVIYPRELCFSPLKNAKGDFSPKTVEEALVKSDRRVLRELLGKEPPEGILEISQDYYYLRERVIELPNTPYLD